MHYFMIKLMKDACFSSKFYKLATKRFVKLAYKVWLQILSTNTLNTFVTIIVHSSCFGSICVVESPTVYCAC